MAEGLGTFLPVQGLKLRCRVDGAAGAPWLVFSNSLMTDLFLWEDQVAAYAGRFRTLRHDQRGDGGSPVPPSPCRFDDLADDLTAVEGAGHLPNIEQPARFNAALDALLARPSGPA